MTDPTPYKVLVVDDEALEANALRRIITQQFTDLVTIQTASNGSLAITAADIMRPDIILMDIEMPGVNGLQAARDIRQMLPRCRIIMVTAYERFQYAQQAISLGVTDYLLKPVATEELLTILTQTMADIDHDRQDASRRATLDQLAREQFVLSVVSGYSSAESLQKQLAELGLPFQYGYAVVLRSAQNESAEAIEAMLMPLLHDEGENGRTVLTYPYDNTLMTLTLATGRYPGEAEVLRLMAVPIEAVYADTGAQLLAGVGAIVTDPGDLHRSYEQAGEALRRATLSAPIVLPSSADLWDTPHKGITRRLYNALLERDMQTAHQYADIMLDTLYAALGQPAAVRQTTVRILTHVAGRLQNDTRMTGTLADTLSTLSQGEDSPQELVIQVRELLASWVCTLEQQPTARIQRIRAEIDRYLRAHYAQDLSIKQVAKAMHYSEPYFSKLFSRCFHRNFVTYLTDIRMQVARDMLTNTMQNVRDISLAVGFSDANYFAKVFRKTYGVSPTEFRRFAGGGEQG